MGHGTTRLTSQRQKKSAKYGAWHDTAYITTAEKVSKVWGMARHGLHHDGRKSQQSMGHGTARAYI